MRIVAGKYRSRLLKSLEGDNTRPTADKVREAVFSKIGPYFDGGCILDLFAGSGAIALEGLSRGLDKAVLVDNNFKAINIIKENVKMLNEEENCEIYHTNYEQALNFLAENGYMFDIIYVDPPYRYRLGTALTTKISQLGILKDDGILIIETKQDEIVDPCENMYLEKEAKYGITKVSYLRKKGN